MKEKDELTALCENMNTRQEEMKVSASKINNFVVAINEIASNNNLNLLDQQKIGVYQDVNSAEDFIKTKMVRVLLFISMIMNIGLCVFLHMNLVMLWLSVIAEIRGL